MPVLPASPVPVSPTCSERPTVRRVAVLLGVFALAGSIVLGTPLSVQAAQPKPPPVQAATQMPSTVQQTIYGYTPDGRPVYTPPYGSEAHAEWKRDMAAKMTAQGYPPPSDYLQDVSGAPEKDVKPISPAKKPTKNPPLGTSVGAAAIAFPVGWAVGSTVGLQIYADVSGQDAEELFCGTPDWYQTMSSSFAMGFTPECFVPVVDPNDDVSAEWTPSTYNGTSVQFVKFAKLSETTTYACFTVSGPTTLPTGISWAYQEQSRLDPTPSSLPNQIPSTSAWNTVRAGCSPATAFSNGATPNHFFIDTKTKNPVGEVAKPSVADPERRFDCQITWDDGTTTKVNGWPYKESEGIPMTAEAMGCQQAYEQRPKGASPTKIDVGSTVDGKRSPFKVDEMHPKTETEKKAEGKTGGLELYKGEDSCLRWHADCGGWWAETEQGTKTTTDYRCTFNTVSVSLTECRIYQKTFEEETDTPTITDPITDKDVDWGTGTNPNTTNPGTGPGTGSDQAPGEQCMAQWSSSPNPIEWVLHPVKCALVWAFVPRQAEVDKATKQLEKSWEATPVSKISIALGAWQFIPPGQGCGGVLVPISQVWPTTSDFRILNACAGEPLAPTAALSTWVIGIIAVLGTTFSMTRSIGGVVAFTGLRGGGSD